VEGGQQDHLGRVGAAAQHPVALLLAGSLAGLFGADLDMLVYGAPMGATELQIGIRLLTPSRRNRRIAHARPPRQLA